MIKTFYKFKFQNNNKLVWINKQTRKKLSVIPSITKTKKQLQLLFLFLEVAQIPGIQSRASAATEYKELDLLLFKVKLM